jgi:hypothetical protein
MKKKVTAEDAENAEEEMIHEEHEVHEGKILSELFSASSASSAVDFLSIWLGYIRPLRDLMPIGSRLAKGSP